MADEPSKQDRRDVDRPHRLFGEEVVKARENLGLTRTALGEQVGISYPMLANVESGRRRASDDIIERLAPALGLSAARLREVRDALEPNPYRVHVAFSNADAPNAVSISHIDDTGDDGGTMQRALELWSGMLVTAQRAETAALAAHPEKGAAVPRMRISADIMRGLGGLSTTDLAKVCGYVDGLRAAREQASTAVSPTTDSPLIRVPAEPFGPLTPWLMPDWIKNVRRVDLSRQARQYRQVRGFSEFARGAGMLLAAGPNDDERRLPCNNHNEAAEAVRVGERLAENLARRAGGNQGMIAAGDWRSLESLRVYRQADSQQADTLNWVVLIGVVATVLWPDDIDVRLDFVKQCISRYKDQVPLLEDK